METSESVEKSVETLEFLTASQLVSLRKPDEDPARFVIGQKYYTLSDDWLEKKAIECALENFKDTLNKKRAARICDLIQAEWIAELNVSITTKLKGKFIQHMGRPSNGKIALSPEESLFLLENGCIEILNGKVPLSTEEAYKVMLKENLSTEKYQVYSHLSQLGFIVVPHQTDLGSSKYEKKSSSDKHQIKRKRKVISIECEEPENKRLTFTGAFSNEPEIPVNSTNQNASSTLISEIPIEEPEFTSHPDDSVSSVEKIDDGIKESNVDEIQIVQATESVEDFPNGVGNFVTIVNEGKEEIKEAASSNVDVPDTNLNQENALSKNDENAPSHPENTLSKDTETALSTDAENTISKDTENSLLKDTDNALSKDTENSLLKDTDNALSKDTETTFLKDTENETNALISCSESTENIKGLDVELVTVEVRPDDEICVQPEEINVHSDFDANSNPLSTSYDLAAASNQSKSSVDVMNVDSQNTEISCASDDLDNNNASDVNVTLEDSSCSVMDAADMDVRDSNSDIMSCSSNEDENLSECSYSEHSERSQEDDEIKLLEVTKKETKPLAVISLSSDEEANSECNSDDDVQFVKVCNAANLNNNANPFNAFYRKVAPCKKEERNSPTAAPNIRSYVPQLRYPNCLKKDVICFRRPPAGYLPSNVCPSKEAYVINLRPKTSQSQQSGVLWSSFRDLQNYQRARQQNRHGNQSFRSYLSRESSRRADAFSSRDARPNSNRRRPDSSANMMNPYADDSSLKDARNSGNHRQTDLPATNPYPPRDAQLNFNHGRNPEAYTNSQDSWQSPWSERNPSGLSREENPNFTHSRSMVPNEAVYPNSQGFNSTNPYNSAQSLQPNPFPYGVPNASAAINSVVSVSNQDMNVRMVNNHIVHPPLHSSSPHLPSFNVNLPNLSAIGPMDIMAEVQRTAYSVATSMLSSMFGQSVNPNLLPRMPVPNAPQPQNTPFGFPPSQFGPVFNAQNSSGDQFSMQSQRPAREPFRRAHRFNPFPCQFRNIRNRSSWNEVREAVGDRNSPLNGGGSDNDDIEEVPINPPDVLWDSKGICPLVKPGKKYLESDVLKMLQVSQMANLSSSTTNTVCFSSNCSLEITFDVYLPGTNFKKTSPDVPKHRIIVLKSSDPIPKFSEIAFLQKKWNDGATLQLAVVDNGDVSYQSFNSVCLPVLIPHKE